MQYGKLFLFLLHFPIHVNGKIRLLRGANKSWQFNWNSSFNLNHEQQQQQQQKDAYNFILKTSSQLQADASNDLKSRRRRRSLKKSVSIHFWPFNSIAFWEQENDCIVSCNQFQQILKLVSPPLSLKSANWTILPPYLFFIPKFHDVNALFLAFRGWINSQATT